MSAVWVKWVPAVAVPAVIAGAAVIVPLQAEARVDLPAKTPEQVLQLVAESSVRALSGTVEQTSNLGLPELPNIQGLGQGSGGMPPSDSPGSDTAPSPGSTAAATGPSASDISSALEFLSSDHTARVYLDGPSKARVQVLDSMAERDVVRNGNDVWLYDSAKNTATEFTLPDRAGLNGHSAKTPGGSESMPTPADLAHTLLAKLDPTTQVTLGDNTRVAGRTAYDLVLAPRASDTLIGQARIAVDSHTGLPLSVVITARGQHDPAFSLAFKKLDLSAPDASRFTFTPPAGATVTKRDLSESLAKLLASSHTGQPDTFNGKPTSPPPTPQPKVIGTGWDAIIEFPAGTVPAGFDSSPLLSQLTEQVAGGRGISTTLINVLITKDGRVLVGSVPMDKLQQAAK